MFGKFAFAQEIPCLAYAPSSNSIIAKALEEGESIRSAAIINLSAFTSVVQLTSFQNDKEVCVEVEQACHEVKLNIKSTGSCDNYQANL